MYENDYTFVTLDNSEDASLLSDAVLVDINGSDDGLDAVMLDDVQASSTDFITLSDDAIIVSENDVVDDSFAIDVNGTDISFII